MQLSASCYAVIFTFISIQLLNISELASQENAPLVNRLLAEAQELPDELIKLGGSITNWGHALRSGKNIESAGQQVIVDAASINARVRALGTAIQA